MLNRLVIGTKEIELTQGYKVIVDDVDFDRISQHKWYIHKASGNLYAKRRNNGQSCLMHRMIMDYPRGMDIRHRNGNGLDNRRENLVCCSRSQNLAAGNMNRSKSKSSKFRGVSWDKNRKSWSSKITFKGKTINLGRCASEKVAAHRYNLKAKELFGEFAVENKL